MAKRTAPEAPPGGDVTDAPAQVSQAGQAATDPGQGITQAPPITDAPADAGPSAVDPVPPSPPRVHPTLAVTARRAMRRGGYAWPAGVTRVEADELSRDEFAALDDDSNFKVDFV